MDRDITPGEAEIPFAAPAPVWGHAAALALSDRVLPHVTDPAMARVVEHTTDALRDSDGDVLLWRTVALDALSVANALHRENIRLRERQIGERQAARLQVAA